MTGRQQLTAVFLVVAVALAGFFLLNRYLGHEISPLGVGIKAPNFEALTLDEQEQRKKTLADYKGDVVLLNVWATWCAPCRAEMPSMEQLHRAYAEKGLKVVAVSIDDPNTQEGIREFAREFNLTFEVLHDPVGSIQRIYQTTGVPETIIIGRDGVIRNKMVGAVDWYSASNRKLIERLLAE
jgi:cytochrome c biogenesis protein CcmG/thiol:disulfide interchange protein DsbE